MRIGNRADDLRIANQREAIALNREISEVLQDFPAYCSRQVVSRFLAYYELFCHIKNVPGWIADVGCYHGFSFFSFCKFLEIHSMGDKTRKVLGFDSFAGFGVLSPADGGENLQVERVEGGTNPSDFRDAFYSLLEASNQDAFAPETQRGILVEGDVTLTVPAFCEKNPGLRLSLLHIDIDVYAPVVSALENLYPRVVVGGLIVLDEFAHVDWPGESKALEDVFFERGWSMPEVRTQTWNGTPTTYFFKNEITMW